MSAYHLGFEDFTQGGKWDSLFTDVDSEASMFRIVVKSNMTLSLVEDLQEQLLGVLTILDKSRGEFHELRILRESVRESLFQSGNGIICPLLPTHSEGEEEKKQDGESWDCPPPPTNLSREDSMMIREFAAKFNCIKVDVPALGQALSNEGILLDNNPSPSSLNMEKLRKRIRRQKSISSHVS